MTWQLHFKLQFHSDKDKKKKKNELADSIDEIIYCNIFEISSVP